jgi:hypothetical protein
MAQTWEESPGTVMTRAERQAKYGGSTQGGIQPSATSPNVFLLSDRVAGLRLAGERVSLVFKLRRFAEVSLLLSTGQVELVRPRPSQQSSSCCAAPVYLRGPQRSQVTMTSGTWHGLECTRRRPVLL